MQLQRLEMERPTNVRQTRIVEQYGRNNKIMVTGTSHIARIADDLTEKGMDVLAVRGGIVTDLMRLIGKEADFPNAPMCTVVFCGGNDLHQINSGMGGDELKNATTVAQGLQSLVNIIQSKLGGKVVTVSIIPRFMGKTGSFRDRFLHTDQVEDVDEAIQQVNADHKHVLTDWFVSSRCMEKRPYGAGGAHRHGQRVSMPELDLYQRDKIHLNGVGNVRLRALIDWIVECVTFEKFDGQKRIDGPKGGVALWKF